MYSNFELCLTSEEFNQLYRNRRFVDWVWVSTTCLLVFFVKFNLNLFLWSLDHQISRSANVCLHFCLFKKTNDHKIYKEKEKLILIILFYVHITRLKNLLSRKYMRRSILSWIFYFSGIKKSSCNIINCYILLLYRKK